MRPSLICLLSTYFVIAAQLGLNGQDTNTTPLKLATVAEQSEYKGTATGSEVEAYLRQLASSWSGSELKSIGSTVEGRAIWSLIVEPQTESKVKPITVLMLGGIHAGECDGKEALLALARDMSQAEGGQWWSSLRMIFVPNFNADANERRGLLHRPGQAGPDQGMGIRENAQGMDLNRDFIKLETPEVRSLVTMLDEYNVDVLIDTHTTNGSLHRYDLTYDIPHNPNVSTKLDSWLRTRLVPWVTKRMEQAGFATFYYGNFDTDHKRWETYGHEPRYSTEYMGMRGRIGILSESYSYVSYQRRVEVSYAFVREVLLGLAENQSEVRQLIDHATAPPSESQRVALDGQLTKSAEAITVQGYQTAEGTPPVPPFGPEALKANNPKDYTVQLWNSSQANKHATIPNAYAVDPQYAWAVSRLVRHGIQVKRLASDTQLDVEKYQISNVKRGRAFQGHALLTVEAKAARESALLPAGTYLIDTQQPLGLLAAFMLEPESDDGLAAWNFFDPKVFAGQEFPVLRVIQSVEAVKLDPVEKVKPGEKITLEHLYSPERTVSYGGGMLRGASWLKDRSEYVIRREEGSFAVDAATGSIRPIDEVRTLAQKLATLTAFSADQAKALATTSAFSEDWKHALIPHRRDLYYFDAESGAARQLTHSPDADEDLTELSPNGKHVAFVRDNNLWVVDTESTELRQLTLDGSKELLNGILDWVYQEELYGRGNFKAYWWSPDSRYIAFLQLDQTAVMSYKVSDSTSVRQKLEDTRYPKAGDPLPTAKMWVADLHSKQLREVDLAAFPVDDRLVARVSWSPSNDLWLQVFNRVQNKQSLVKVDLASFAATTLFTESTPGWIEVLGTPRFLPSGDFLWLSDLPEGRRHLYRVALATGEKTALTSGEWDVDSLLSISSNQQTAFVSGNISHPIEQQLIAVDIDQGTIRQVTATPGTHRVNVDASGQYFIDTFSSASQPPVTSVNTINGELLRVISAPVSDRHAYVDIRTPILTTIKARDGLELQTQILLPTNWDAGQPGKKLPVLFHVYGGPQAPTVQNSWPSGSYWWHQMLCQQGFAVVLCDNRSARGRGIRDTWTARGDLGSVEMRDLEDAAKWVAEQPWADSSRFGMWGWSYGGYFTAYAMTHSTLFRAGIAGAPVTDWQNYDAIYTERYMDLPKTNEAGYKSSSVVKAAANLSGRLLLIHGERDDNVHISNTLQLAGALQNAGKQFDLMVYPSNRHGITDPQQRYHMQRLMTEFLQRNLSAP